ncbi:MAG: PadR family transcriptional regulator, partial [Candidatus Lokiarchaeota archaeon]|nr:PadR family transcriptional regulator [Candidatus Lokiarchaeota archaeon]
MRHPHPFGFDDSPPAPPGGPWCPGHDPGFPGGPGPCGPGGHHDRMHAGMAPHNPGAPCGPGFPGSTGPCNPGGPHGPGFPGGPGPSGMGSLPGPMHGPMPPSGPGFGAWFGPPGPPGHHGGPHGPHPPPPGPQGPWFGPPGPPPLLSREAFQEIKYLFLLMLIAEYQDGITGYQLQDKYAIPRGNLVRTLDELEHDGYVSTREDVKEGRNQKYYTVTAKGKEYVEQLKEDWASRFAMLSEMAPPDVHGNPFRRPRHQRRMLEHVDSLETKEDALDYFKGIRHSLKGFLDHVNRRAKRVEQTKATLDVIIKKIEDMETFDVQAVKELVKQAPAEMDDEGPPGPP